MNVCKRTQHHKQRSTCLAIAKFKSDHTCISYSCLFLWRPLLPNSTCTCRHRVTSSLLNWHWTALLVSQETALKEDARFGIELQHLLTLNAKVSSWPFWCPITIDAIALVSSASNNCIRYLNDGEKTRVTVYKSKAYHRGYNMQRIPSHPNTLPDSTFSHVKDYQQS